MNTQYIRRRVGGRKDAWDQDDQYTRVDRVFPSATYPGHVHVVIEGKVWLTNLEYVFELVELVPMLAGDGTPVTRGGNYQDGESEYLLNSAGAWNRWTPETGDEREVPFESVDLSTLRRAP